MEDSVNEKPAETVQETAKPKMKKGLKIALYALGGLLAFVVFVVVTLPLWISPVATSVAEAITPGYTGCQFKLEKFNLNPFTGKLRIVEAHLSNPEGYKEPEAFSVATVSVEVATCSLLSSTIHVKDITIQGPFVGITSEGGTNNFMAILANLEAKLGPSEEEKSEEDEKPFKKVIIDRFELSGTRVKYGIPIAIPSVVLKDIGKSSDGATFSEVAKEIMDACMKFVTDLGGNAMNLLKAAGAGVSDTASKVLGDGAKNATQALGDGAKNAAESLKKLNPFGK